MNNKIYIVDRNGNQIIAEGISLINLKGDSYSNDYLFYTLNEVVNGGLNKIYVAKVNVDDKTISEDEWHNIKEIMLAITHQETVDGLSYGNIFDEKGEGKTFNIDVPRKIALKLDKLTALRDAYKLATTNPDSNSNTAAVGNVASNVPTVEIVDNNAQVVQETKVEPVQVVEAPVVEPAPVAPVDIQPVTVETVPASQAIKETPQDVVTIPTPEVPKLDVVAEPVPTDAQPIKVEAQVTETQPVALADPQRVSEEPAVGPVSQQPLQQEISEPIKSIVPTPIPEVLYENKNSDDYAIPVSQPQVTTQETDTDDEVFNEIIKELKDIRSQNEEIKESIRKLTNNIANINTNLSGQEIKQAQGNYDGMINTNMANTTEDVSAIDITSNGTVVIPSFEEAQKSAIQSANVLSNNIIEPSTVIDTQVAQTTLTDPVNQMIEQPVQNIIQPVETPSVETPQAIEQPVNIAPPIVNIPEPIVTDPIPNVQPQVGTQIVPPVETPVLQPSPVAVAPQAQVVETQVNEVPELPQIIPDVPMASDQPNMIIPEFDPNAGLPPVQMPTGVAAGEDSSAVGSTITGLPQ